MARKRTSGPGELIVAALQQKGWTQAKLSQVSGITTVALNDYITGNRKGINGRQVLRIAVPLGLDPYDLAFAFVKNEIDVELKKVMKSLLTEESAQ